MIRTSVVTVRCRLYAQIHGENLDHECNSLDAQRESAEAYMASQKSEGWICLPVNCNDGGYTGGNMERPALKRLLADISAGKELKCRRHTCFAFSLPLWRAKAI